MQPRRTLRCLFFFFAVFISNTGFAQSDSAAVVNARWQVIRVAPGIILEHAWFDSSLFQSNQNISILKVKLNRKNRVDIAFDPHLLKPTHEYAAEKNAIAERYFF